MHNSTFMNHVVFTGIFLDLRRREWFGFFGTQGLERWKIDGAVAVNENLPRIQIISSTSPEQAGKLVRMDFVSKAPSSLNDNILGRTLAEAKSATILPFKRIEKLD